MDGHVHDVREHLAAVAFWVHPQVQACRTGPSWPPDHGCTNNAYESSKHIVASLLTHFRQLCKTVDFSAALIGSILQYGLKALRYAARARGVLLSSSPLHCTMVAQAKSLSSITLWWLPCWIASLRGLLPAAWGGVMQAELPAIEAKASIFVTSTPPTGGARVLRQSSMPRQLRIDLDTRPH